MGFNLFQVHGAGSFRSSTRLSEKDFDSRAGFGILEVLIASGLMGMLALAMTSLMSNQMKGEKGAKFSLEVETLTAEIRAILSSPLACGNSFSPLVMNTSALYAPADIKDSTGATKYSVGRVYGDRAILLQSLQLAGYVDLGGTEGRILLTLKFKVNGEAAGPQWIQRNVELQTKKLTDGTDRLVDCISLSKMSDGIWRLNNPVPPLSGPLAAGTNWDTYYMGGQVSIGTNLPVPGTALTVQGKYSGWQAVFGPGLSAPTGAGNVLGIWTGEDAGGVRPRVSLNAMRPGSQLSLVIAGPPPGNEALTVDTNANVGIGTSSPSTKLQVAGEISPAGDNFYSLGDATHRFSMVFSVNGTLQTSDRREKTGIRPTDLGLAFLASLRPVSFHWKSGDRNTHYGFIAQELEKSIEKAKARVGIEASAGDNVIVEHDPSSDKYGVRYTELLAPTIKAIQELYQSLKNVEAALTGLLIEKADAARRLELLEQAVETQRLEMERMRESVCARDAAMPVCEKK